MKRKVKVLEVPITFIEVDSELSDEEIKTTWIKKYNKLNVSPASQVLEAGMIRGAKKMNRTNK